MALAKQSGKVTGAVYAIEMLAALSKLQNSGYSKLTHYLITSHIMPYFDLLKIYSCGKHCEKGRNCL